MAIPRDVVEHVAAHDLTRRSPVQSAARTAIAVCLYAGLALAARSAGHPAVWAVAWALQSVLLVGAYSAMHEAAHDALFRSRTANRVAGVLWAASVLIPFSLYRAYHLHHHSHTRTPDDSEPQGELTSVAQYVLGLPFIGLGFVGGLLTDAARTLAGRPPHYVRTARQRSAIRTDVAAVVVLLGGVAAVAAAAPALVVTTWVVPLAAAYALAFTITALPEHYACPPSVDPLVHTRTVVSNPLFRFLYWNNNFHAEHHLYPAVPYNHAPALHRFLAGRHSNLSRSYTAFHAAVVRDLRREGAAAVVEG